MREKSVLKDGVRGLTVFVFYRLLAGKSQHIKICRCDSKFNPEELDGLYSHTTSKYMRHSYMRGSTEY